MEGIAIFLIVILNSSIAAVTEKSARRFCSLRYCVSSTPYGEDLYSQCQKCIIHYTGYPNPPFYFAYYFTQNREGVVFGSVRGHLK